jgi:NAD+ synthase
MTIKNLELLTAELISWCQQHAAEAGAEGAVVGVSGGVDSAVVLALCARAFPGKTTGVMMPCHSSKSSLERSEELFAALNTLHPKYKVRRQLVNLDIAFRSVSTQYRHLGNSFDENFVYGALRSCLRAPTLDFIAKAENALVFGTGNRDEDEMFRYYQKRGDGCVDNNVLACLHKSEVWELARHLSVPRSIVEAVPTADLWGAESDQTDESELGISYEEIEWVTKENDEHLVVSSVDVLWNSDIDMSMDEAELQRGAKYTDREKVVIRAAYHAEKSTRHKAELPPSPSRRELLELSVVE